MNYYKVVGNTSAVAAVSGTIQYNFSAWGVTKGQFCVLEQFWCFATYFVTVAPTIFYNLPGQASITGLNSNSQKPVWDRNVNAGNIILPIGSVQFIDLNIMVGEISRVADPTFSVVVTGYPGVDPLTITSSFVCVLGLKFYSKKEIKDLFDI